MINDNGITHNPEKPSLHRGKRYPKSDVLKNMQEKDHRDPESRVEIVENESERSEERLHHQEGQVNDQMEGPKTPGGPIKACHEVDNDVVDEDPRRREGKVS